MGYNRPCLSSPSLYFKVRLSVKPSVHLHRKDVDFHCALIFKVRVLGTQKSAINFFTFTLHCTVVWFWKIQCLISSDLKCTVIGACQDLHCKMTKMHQSCRTRKSFFVSICCGSIFILGLIFIFLCSRLISCIIHFYTQKQRKIKIKPRIKLNHNTCMLKFELANPEFAVQKFLVVHTLISLIS